MTPTDYWTGWLLMGAGYCLFQIVTIGLLYLIWKK
jgi:hypothetical protein